MSIIADAIIEMVDLEDFTIDELVVLIDVVEIEVQIDEEMEKVPWEQISFQNKVVVDEVQVHTN